MKDHKSNLFAYLSRMRLINRWPLMSNTYQENIQQHSLQVAMIAHCLVLIRNEIYKEDLNSDRVVTLAVFHDATEVITGDLPTPIKYFNPKIKEAYSEIEKYAADSFLNMVPSEIKDKYDPLFHKHDDDLVYWKIVKHADRISAYLKCMEELKSGNKEFSKAEKFLKADIDKVKDKEVVYFMENFVPAFNLTLDELG